jgi:hypothetical protein
VKNKNRVFIIVMLAYLIMTFTIYNSYADSPQVWGLDSGIISKYEYARGEVYNTCTRPASDWRNGSYPNLPSDIERLPIPGGGYQGIWYWDSCFMSQQLMSINDQYFVAEDAFSMFCWELDNFGKIDNEILISDGETSHPRSQMPLFVWLADQLYKTNNDLVFLKKAYDHGKAEMNNFWMNTGRTRPRYDSTSQLNHNDTDNTSGSRNQESAWEHGWDNSARMDTPTENWYRVLPVDVNAVLYFNEKKLAEWGGILKNNGYAITQAEIDQWNSNAVNRQSKMEQYFYNATEKFYFDYDLDQANRSGYQSLAPAWLVWSGALSDTKVKEVANYIAANFIQPYNLPPVTLSTNYPSWGAGCGWSNPWSWSPVIYLMTDGFSKYDYLTPVTENLVDKFLQYHGGKAEKYDVNGNPGGVSVLGWGMSVYYNMVQNYKLGFRSDMTNHKVTFKPYHIVNGMGGRFNVYNHQDVSVTYVKSGSTTIGADIDANENYNLELYLYFDVNTDIFTYPVYLNGSLLNSSKYQLVNLDSDSTYEGYKITDQLTPGVTYRIRIGDPNFNPPSATPSPTPSANLALNKPVTVSSVEKSGMEGPNAVDGNAGTRWASLYSSPQWIYVDLGTVYNINRVVLRWETAHATEYKIQVSNDASNWTDIYSTTTGDGDVDDLSLSGTGRYVRMHGIKPYATYFYSLWEFEIYGTSGGSTPTPTPISTSTPTPTSAATSTPTPTPAITFTPTPIKTPTPTPIATATPSPTPVPAGNLALNKPVMVSSVERTGMEGANAVDGNTGTRWASLYSSPQWIYVDLGSVYNINRVVLRWETAHATEYKIQVSNDASAWTDIYYTTSGDGGVDDLSVTGTGRYVRMYGITPYGSYFYSLWEFEVYGAGSNLAVNKAASADSSQSTNPASNGNDGNTTTRWCANDGNAGHWWKVDLGASYNLTGSEVMWEKSGKVYKYKVEVSADNTNWTLKADKTNNTSTAQTQSDSFSGVARYVRITVTGMESGCWASFFEFRVFGN